MKLRNKIVSLLLALLLILPNMGVAFADTTGNAVSIGTAEEFIEFTHNCSLDTWSQGKTVTLTANIDLTGYDNITIPAFSGTFNGAGFTISGVLIADSGANQGLFRYICKGASVIDLTVQGTVIAGGEAVNIGGIAGSNAGTVQRCTFEGTVVGETAVGGIAGTNEKDGRIVESTTRGNVDGVTSVGGTAGINYGTLTKCANHAFVGTDPQEGGSYDIGGIAGYSTGTIESSTNVGVVGTLHTGYNVGGVVGRQDGLVNGAKNEGEVYGRKDVGGIVGQAEPTINIIFTEDLLEKLNTELKNLYQLITDSLEDSDKLTADIQKRLKNASDYISKASTSTNTLLSQLSGTVAGGSDLNSSTAIIYASLGNYSAVMHDMTSALSDMADASEDMIAVLKTISSIANNGASSISKAQTAATAFDKAVNEIGEAVEDIADDISTLRNAVLQENEEKMEKALTDLCGHITALGDALEKSSEATSDLKKHLAGLMSSDSTNQKKVQDALKTIVDTLDDMAESADDMSASAAKIDAAVDVKWIPLQICLRDMSEAAEEMGKSAGKVQTSCAAISDAIDDFEPSVAALGDPMKKLSTATETYGDTFKELSTALSKIDSYLTDLSKADPSDTATSLGSSFTTQSQTLYRNIVSLSSELTGISTSIGTGNKDNSTNTKAINDQLLKVMGLVVEALEETGETGSVTDVSDDKAASATTGKIMASTNAGVVTGDRDVGGVVGTMSIQNELDHEDEYSDTLSADNQYEIMAIVTDCQNTGEVVGTKESTGGIAGRMELGTVVDCENYGVVEGNGKYTGGIAGLSNATVRKSYSKGIISGESYVGGIVGMGNRVDACYAIVVIDGTEYVGAVAGWGDTTGQLVTDNYYIDNGVAAVDGISYHGVAEPLAVASMKSRADVPAGFADFTITCINDGEVLHKVTVEYGADLSQVEMPEVPEREGFYGSWSDFTTELMLINQTVYAEYGEYISVVSSDELDNGVAFALAEGQLTKYAKLNVYESEEAAPSDDAWSVWDVYFTDKGVTEETVTTIKLLNQTKELASIWQLRDGEWVELDTTRDGQYLQISMTGTSGTFCFRPDYMMIVLLIAIFVVAVIGIVMVIILMLRNRKKGKGKKAPKKPAKPKKVKTAKAEKDRISARKARKLKQEEPVNSEPEITYNPDEPLIPEFFIPEDRPVKGVTEEQIIPEEKPVEAEPEIVPDLEDNFIPEFFAPEEKPRKLTLKEKSAKRRREKCEKRRAQRALERNREAE
ncbi:MAG: hypothetical protein E7456_02880 [Ruminococcaceae bacterium]|nr:hypothetical protein [Oscillospiraceae bacterium]